MTTADVIKPYLSDLAETPEIAQAYVSDCSTRLQIKLTALGHDQLKSTSIQAITQIINRKLHEIGHSEPLQDCEIEYIDHRPAQLAHLCGNDWPQWLSFVRDENVLEFVIKLQPSLTWFRGHFPGHPVLAGVVQIHWVGEIGKVLFNLEMAPINVENLKFQRIIEPNTQLTLTLNYSPALQRIAFSYSGTDGDYSKGRIRFL